MRRRVERRNEKQKNGLNDIHFSPHIIRFTVGDSRKNNGEDRVILTTSIMLSKNTLLISSGRKGNTGGTLVKSKFKSRLPLSPHSHTAAQLIFGRGK